MLLASLAARLSAPSTGGVPKDDIFEGFEIDVAPRPAKRRKQNPVEEIDGDAPSPVIFLSPGLKNDVRFKVYGKFEYHLHSVVLKLHSAFFRRFLDSPEKSDDPASSEFQYEYVSVEDEQGWLVEPRREPSSPWSGESPSDTIDQKAFEKLLCAFYNRDYTVESTDELKAMTAIADYYCALPILSKTLKGALLGSPIFDLNNNDRRSPFKENSYDLIFTAQKLRHAELFRECFVHIVGTWVDGPVPKDSLNRLKHDPELLSLISASHIDLCRALLELNQEILLMIVEREEEDILSVDNGPNRMRRPTRNAAYYRALETQFELKDFSDDCPMLWRAFGNLFKNNLIFDRSGLGAGEGPYQYFLCASIKDEDLPWDPKEVDF
ncbi:hypothetical protein EG329_009099 [Mollisiaceae sp. DMI_Dod_QoI]|nr:hypothetical protein EG329_009099 [Helotiales sp. DMI_Dod_QoI]